MEFTIDLLLFLLSIFAVWFSLLLVFRTEKELDRFCKYLLLTSIVLFLSSGLKLDKHFGVFSKSYADNIFYGSRLLSVISYLAALVTMLKITKIKKQ